MVGVEQTAHHRQIPLGRVLERHTSNKIKDSDVFRVVRVEQGGKISKQTCWDGLVYGYFLGDLCRAADKITKLGKLLQAYGFKKDVVAACLRAVASQKPSRKATGRRQKIPSSNFPKKDKLIRVRCGCERKQLHSAPKLQQGV